MKKGQKVYWYDLVTGKVRSGKIVERQLVVAEAKITKEDDLNYIEESLKDVHRYDWEILTSSGARFAMPEDLLSTEPLYN